MSRPKPTIRLYEVYAADKAWLARVVLTSDGYFSTVSDYGNYAFQWRDFGPGDFRAFLAGCNADYILSKVSTRSEWDGEPMLKAVKRAILDRRRSRKLSREQARGEMLELDEAEEFGSEADVALWLERTELRDAHGIIMDCRSLAYPSDAKMFCERVMPRLREMMTAELAAEATRPALLARCLYFGCWDNQAGHFLHGPSGRCSSSDPAGRVGTEGLSIDGLLAPRRTRDRTLCWEGQEASHRERSRLHSNSGECQQGQFLLHHLDNGFTAISWWDRCQGDTRPGCNSTVLLEGKHTSEEMLEALRLRFPHVLANLQKAGVELVDVTGQVSK